VLQGGVAKSSSIWWVTKNKVERLLTQWKLQARSVTTKYLTMIVEIQLRYILIDNFARR